MAENVTVARPYAEAAFGVADASGALPAWAHALDVLSQVVLHPEVRAAIGNPRLTEEQVYAVIAALSGDAMTADIQKFVRLLIENERLALLPEIHDMFQELKNEREGVVDALVATAFELTPAQIADLVADLERRFKRRMKPVVTVDTQLIGGVRVSIGDEVIDSSVRGQLAAMASALQR
jgi:F-type H+-transporting ATPase subunit delta